MDVIVDVSVDMKAAMKYLDDVELRQLPYAISVALNDTMVDAQADVRQEYDRVFETRNRSLAKAITTIRRGDFATKRKLEVVMGAVRDGRTGREAGEGFITRQMQGRRKTPRGSSIAIPIIGPGLRRLKGGSVPKAKKPRANPRLFKKGKGGRILYERPKGKGKKLVRRYVLAKTAKPSSRGRFNYVPVFERRVNRSFNTNFNRAFQRAVVTAERRVR